MLLNVSFMTIRKLHACWMPGTQWFIGIVQLVKSFKNFLNNRLEKMNFWDAKMGACCQNHPNMKAVFHWIFDELRLLKVVLHNRFDFGSNSAYLCTPRNLIPRKKSNVFHSNLRSHFSQNINFTSETSLIFLHRNWNASFGNVRNSQFF